MGIQSMNKTLSVGLAGLVGFGFIVGIAKRIYDRAHSHPSTAIEQQLSQNTIYQEIASQSTQSPLQRELRGLVTDFTYPYFLHWKASPELKEYLKTNRIDAAGNHMPYSDVECAVLWHIGCNPTSHSPSKDYMLATVKALAFRK